MVVRRFSTFRRKDTDVTTRSLSDLLPYILLQLEQKIGENPKQIVSSWPSIVGSRVAKLTRADRFDSGILWVYVTHSTLHSLLVEHEKKRLLRELKQKFPSVLIRDIVFRIG